MFSKRSHNTYILYFSLNSWMLMWYVFTFLGKLFPNNSSKVQNFSLSTALTQFALQSNYRVIYCCAWGLTQSFSGLTIAFLNFIITSPPMTSFQLFKVLRMRAISGDNNLTVQIVNQSFVKYQWLCITPMQSPLSFLAVSSRTNGVFDYLIIQKGSSWTEITLAIACKSKIQCHSLPS